MAAADCVDVEVVYALPQRQRTIRVRAARGATVMDVVRQSGILAEFPEIDAAAAPLGIFSRRVSADAQVHEGDRIEIYRPLLADPKRVRRERAKNRGPAASGER